MKLRDKYPDVSFIQVAAHNPILCRNSGAATAWDTKSNKTGSCFQATSNLIVERQR